MKKRNKSLVLILLISILTIIVSACSGTPGTPGNPSEDTKKPNTLTPSDIDDKATSTHITQELCDGVAVNADIIYPERQEYEVLNVKYANYGVELLKEIFLQNDSSTATVDTSDGVTITTQNGSFIKSRYGRVIYDAPDDKTYATIEDLLWQFAQGNGYFNDTELPFMSREDALNQVLSVIEKLDMPGTPEVSTFVGLDHEALIEVQQTMLGNEDYNEILGWDKIIELKGLTENEDAYFIRVAFKRADLSLYDQFVEMNAEFAGDRVSTPSAYVEALITPAGIVSFTVEGCFSPVSGQTETCEIVSLETVFLKVREKYELQIVSLPVTFTKIYMEYMTLRETTEQLKIVPYWVLEYGYTREDGVFQLTGAERFNAVTGEDLAYGG